MRRTARWGMDNGGQTIVEFALIVSLLLAILFGIAEFGRAWFYANHLSNSVRATARYAAVLRCFDPNCITAFLRDEIQDPDKDGPMNADDIAEGSPSVMVLDKDDGSPKDEADIQKGDTIVITATYNFNFVVSDFFLEMFHKDATWPLTRTASMVYEEEDVCPPVQPCQ